MKNATAFLILLLLTLSFTTKVYSSGNDIYDSGTYDTESDQYSAGNTVSQELHIVGSTLDNIRFVRFYMKSDGAYTQSLQGNGGWGFRSYSDQYSTYDYFGNVSTGTYEIDIYDMTDDAQQCTNCGADFTTETGHIYQIDYNFTSIDDSDKSEDGNYYTFTWGFDGSGHLLGSSSSVEDGQLYDGLPHNGTRDGSLDDMALYLGTDDSFDPTGSLSADSVDVNDLTIDLTGSGDFGVTGEGYKASLVIQAICEDPTTDDFQYGTNVANVSWDADDNVTDTFHEGGKYYTGAGYTDTDSTYSFSGVTVPYVRDYNCQYPAYAFIYDGDGNVVYSNIDEENTIGGAGNELFDFDPTDPPDPAITFTTGSPTSSESEPVLETENDGLFGKFVEWFNEKVISPQVVINTVKDYHTSIRSLMSAKAPFGYFMFMQDIDHSVPTTTDSIPNWDWQLGDSVYFDNGFVNDVAFLPDIQTTLTWVRDEIITRALIIIMGVYLITVGKRVFKN